MNPPSLLLTAPFLSLALFTCEHDHDDHDHNPADMNLPTCDEDTRDEAYFAGISKTGDNGITLAIMDSDNAPPAKGDNVWRVKITDATDMALSGMTIKSGTWMPDHSHGSPVVPTITEEGNGEYTIDPVNLFMPGYWEVTLSAVDPGGAGPDDDMILDSVVFKFCIEG
ncbi:MAG: FixH family protein [Kofleriaceae bacterium]|nr:FixH family protein [Kofleriaceae bacterium]